MAVFFQLPPTPTHPTLFTLEASSNPSSMGHAPQINLYIYGIYIRYVVSEYLYTICILTDVCSVLFGLLREGQQQKHRNRKRRKKFRKHTHTHTQTLGNKEKRRKENEVQRMKNVVIFCKCKK